MTRELTCEPGYPSFEGMGKTIGMKRQGQVSCANPALPRVPGIDEYYCSVVLFRSDPLTALSV